MTLEEALASYTENHQVDGIPFTRHDHGLYWTDDDNALYAGIQLGAMAYRYAADPSADKLEAIRMSLRGISLLTTVTGTRGVLVRRVMPSRMSSRFGLDYPLSEGNYWYDRPLESRDGYTFLLKTTKDQVTGVLFGLSVCRKLLAGVDAQIDDSVTTIIRDLYNAITERKWSLRDHNWKTHGTSAHKLDAPLRLNLEALAYSIGHIEDRPHQPWFNYVGVMTIHYNTLIQNAYSHGLNAVTAHSLDILSDHHKEANGVKQWMHKINWTIASEHNPFWELLLNGTTTEEGDERLDALADEPYTRFFIWNKYRAEITQRELTTGPQIDYMVAGYMREYYRSTP